MAAHPLSGPGGLLGEHDTSTPTVVVAPRLLDALGAGNGHQIVVLPDVGHTMLVEERGTNFDSLRVGTFAPAFVALMNDWIERWLMPEAGRAPTLSDSVSDA